MGGRKNRETPANLVRAAGRFAAWRRERALGARIPESLWRQAIALAGRHGLSRTATALGLDYYALKKRVEAQASARGHGSLRRPAFVELAVPAHGTSPVTTSRGDVSSPATPGECLIELANATGVSLRIHLKGHQLPDLVALGRSFWNIE
jgi:hypothetical protein